MNSPTTTAPAPLVDSAAILDALWAIAEAIAESHSESGAHAVTSTSPDGQDDADPGQPRNPEIAWILDGGPGAYVDIRSHMLTAAEARLAIIPFGVTVDRIDYDEYGRWRLRDADSGYMWLANSLSPFDMDVTVVNFVTPVSIAADLSSFGMDREEELLSGRLDPHIEHVEPTPENVEGFWAEPAEDVVNMPSHYRQEDGLECIDFNYDLPGPWFSVVRYVWRCMDKGNPVQDLQKALRYIDIAEEKGVWKPEDAVRSAILYDLWLQESEDDVSEWRYYALYYTFKRGGSPDDVRACIEGLIRAIEGEQE